ncbi:MAG: 3-deoxy-7-phosphoheptulonate synthase [Planctomycetota bacterium]
MVITMKVGHTKEQVDAVVRLVQARGYTAHIMPGVAMAVCITGNAGRVDPRPFMLLEGVAEAVPVTKPYKLPSRDVQAADTVIDIATPSGRTIGIGRKGFMPVIAGPCSVESEDQLMRIAKVVKDAGAHLLRGGAFKPRSSAFAFQGMGEDGLKILAAARETFDLPVVTEALDQHTAELVARYTDVIQIGARNMQNYALLRDVGKLNKPVMLKRGMSATLEEWLQAAEYIMAEGNAKVMLCERGIRTFATHTRNTLDLNVVPVVQRLSHLPILVDPSHGTGIRNMVAPLARAAAALPCHGQMIEVHDRPDEALSDGPQSLLPEQFSQLMTELDAIGKALGFRVRDAA